MTTSDEVLDTLSGLEDPKIRAVNERHGDDHAVNLSKLRAVAKDLKKNDDLARQLWDTGDTGARLVAILIMRPRSWDAEALDAMLRESRVPKVHGWLVNYIVKKSSHAEALRRRWMTDPDPVVASAGWALTSDGPSASVSASACSETTRPRRDAPRPSPRSGSPRSCAAGSRSEPAQPCARLGCCRWKSLTCWKV